MEGNYPVLLHGASAGTVTITQKGLYYGFYAQCQLPSRPCRLQAVFSDMIMDLGIFVPQGAFYCVQKWVPVKKMGKGTVSFQVADQEAENTKYIRADPNSPFPYLENLMQMRLVTVDGEAVLQIDG